MGGKIVVPEPDVNIRRVIKNFHLNPKDISDFWKLFQKLDKEKTGLVPLNKIFKSFEMERNLLTDCLMELLEIEHDGEINFSDFLLMVTTYCFFEPTEILKFCFFCFDQDKSGFFSIDDLNNLMNVAHNVKTGKTVQGTVKASWMMLTFKGDQIDFQEFAKIHNAFPRLFSPAFRLQQLMMIHTKGEVWWTLKKRTMQDRRDEAALKAKNLEARKDRTKERKKARKIQRNMGLLRYYLCPCFRSLYDPTLTAYDKLSEEEKAEWDRQAAKARREAELKLKNPETAVWLKYEQKLKLKEIKEEEKEEGEENSATDHNNNIASHENDPSKLAVVVANSNMGEAGGNQDSALTSTRKTGQVVPYLEKKMQQTQRPREDRANRREERRKERKRQLEEL